jgi:hypothetical protein
MIWNWYVARENEIFIDMDSYTKSIDLCRRRLSAGVDAGILNVDFVYNTQTSHDHNHIIIVLKNPMRDIQRIAWAIALHSDIYRGLCTLMRADAMIPAPDVLIGKRLYHRLPDAQCDCETKHVSGTMQNCHAAKLLRGEFHSASFFGRKTYKRSDLL